ncbi:MAG: ATP-binding protein [Deltaproteobacteria bacterium]|nr:ATP-binding protein [Deltaproteobacteria bacterium]
MSKLHSISITNIKGIGAQKTFELGLFPNKPSLLVAPNGFGKSSLACAFNSMNGNRIDLAEKDYHEKNAANLPIISINFDGTQYDATNATNAIAGAFDVFVINSQVVAKATKRNMGRFTTVSASLDVTSVVLIDRIPAKVDFAYSHPQCKRTFGTNGKILPDATPLLNNLEFLARLEAGTDFHNFGLVRAYKLLVDPVIDNINRQPGSGDQIKVWMSTNVMTDLEAIAPLKALKTVIKEVTGNDDVESYLLAWQLARESQDANFRAALEYKLYLREKKFYDELLKSFDTTRHNICTSEDKIDKTKKKLVVNFPRADEISNGQRDVLTFVAQLHRARRKLKKPNCILIIDEIFDYLDDANLVAFQYYITQFIEEFKAQTRNLYPLLLTHLDPAYFRHFCFNRHKLQVRYLNKDAAATQSACLSLVRKRDDPSIEAAVSAHHFHFNPAEQDLQAEFGALALNVAWGKSHEFYVYVKGEAEKYLRIQQYDAIAVLLAVRICIETLAYNKLPADAKQGFIDTHKTASKLDYCEEHGVAIPETYYLLGLIYNDDLHWREGRDYDTPLRAKLENLTIRNMMKEVLSEKSTS